MRRAKRSTMTDFEAKPVEKPAKKKKKKRKLISSEEKQRAFKTPRIVHSEEEKEPKEAEEEEKAQQREQYQKLEGARPWRNLQLILSIQNKDLDLQTKVQLAFDFVNSRVNDEDGDSDQGLETVSISRLVVFLSDWIQSVLISLEKKNRVEGEKLHSNVVGTCLDFRCWEVFKFCLEESLKLHVSLKFSRNLLRAIGCVARNALSLLNGASLASKESFFVGEGFELFSIVPDCVSLVFLSHGGLLNENLDSWVSTVGSVLEVVQKVCSDDLDAGNAGVFVLRFSCLVLDPFSKFLRVHPCRKSGFRDFIDKLLEPLLHLLGVLHLQINGSNPGWTRNLLKSVEEVLSLGLFHPSHIDEFLSLHSTEKYVTSNFRKSKDAKTVIKSYHRHLFDKLEKIMAAKKVSILGGIGDLFRLLVDRVKRQKGASVLSDGTEITGKRGGSLHLEEDFSGHMSKMLSGKNSGLSERSYCSGSLNAETRKSIFDFFVQIMEPLLFEINSYLQTELEAEPVLLDVLCIFKTINNILSSFMHEKVYVRTEDNSEGACLNFLKKVYDMITSLSARINKVCLSTHEIDKGTHTEISNLIVGELILAVGYFLEIEYEVIAGDLVSLWLMMLLYLATSLSSMGAPEQCLLASNILELGCQLVKLYSELRQVNSIIFALCKAVRLLLLRDSDGEMNCSGFISCTTSLSYEAYAKSVGMLVCSQEFRFVICNAIKSIPEGQVSGCIRRLTMDIAESLEWMKKNCSVTTGKEFEQPDLRSGSMTRFDVQAEILGRVLSELYTLVLDSLTVTTGNSNLVGVSIKDLMKVIHPSLSSLVGLHPDSVNKFLFCVTGGTFDNMLAGCKNDLPKLGGSTHWVFLFFFRLYISCRSLYRQAISLAPPDSSRKLSAVMGDLYTAYSGRDWMESTDCTDEGYFSCIVQPSASLLITIQSVSNICIQGSVADCSPLIYVLHTMAIQRLVDLSRQIKSFEYLLQRNDNLVQNKLIDAAGLSLYRKQSRKWERCISVLKHEAGGLTDFVMEFLSLMAKKQQSMSSVEDATCMDICDQALHEIEAWDLGVCAVNEKSLPTAIWWIVCQNTDVWCTHAAKKKLKMFLSLLIRTFLPCMRSSFGEVKKQRINKPDHLRNVTVQQISSELLSDTVLYEQRFVCRHLETTFCRILEKSVLSIFSDSSYRDFNFSSSPNWPEVLSELDKSVVVISGGKHVMDDCSPEAEPLSHLSNKFFPLSSMEFTVCQSLLNLLCWMPKRCSNSQSFSLYATYILNLERLVVRSLLNHHGALYSHNHYELFRMFVSCRRTLKYLIMASCEEKMEASQSSLISILSEGSFLELWLLKSVSAIVGLEHAFSEDCGGQVKDMIFSLMDHTSYVFLALSKDQFRLAVDFLVYAGKPSKEQFNPGVASVQSNLNESDPCLDSSKDIDAWKSVVLVAETLKEQTRSLLISLKNTFHNEKMGVGVSVVELNKLSSMVSCLQGFLWGLASAVNHIDAKNSVQPKILRWKREPISRLNLCINVFTDFIKIFLRVMLFEDDRQPESIRDVQSHLKSDCCDDSLGVEEFSPKVSGSQSDVSCGKQREKSGAARNDLVSSDINGESGNTNAWKKSLQSYGTDCAAIVLAEIDSFDQQCLNKPLLQNLLNGNNPEAAFSLRQLFIASSALLRLNLQINYTPLSTSLVPIFIGISQVLLLELADMAVVPQPFSFVWLDGVLKYLEEIGCHLPLTNPILSRNVYTKLIDLHLRAIGKCIALQGKRATLASHETESSTKTLNGHIGLPDAGPYHLDEFKARLRMSFRVFISKPSELHLLSSIQALERALVGVQEGCTMIYEINTGGADGGKVSSIVAAGIDCLDLVLEFVAGRKRLSVVKRHIQSLTAGLFNIILHLQSPLIFYGKLICNKGDAGPDPGSVILMCVEVLTRISGKQALFQMDSCHVGQSLRIPAALFQDFHQLKLSNSLMLMDNQDYNPESSMSSCVVDRRFSIDLFAACCRLLYTILKHHKSECERCVALLEDSVCVLLHCLETVNADSVVMKGSFAWEVQEGVKCACFLRRIYEEIRHQKDVFSQHCFQFLSSYIWIYSGYGPLKAGIKREIDEALRPGVYALIDACSANDLQHLHTVFGEGPCRSTLAALQRDYKLNFQYEGKV